ncbi:MAG: hypothetical protein HC866_07950 [Leptolyngbyaceae cyanobacterium RU_5_1]|nr:hypothetical protein [Leptolyngbyaceae cyanobacterium RU_5_1]
MGKQDASHSQKDLIRYIQAAQDQFQLLWERTQQQLEPDNELLKETLSIPLPMNIADP